MRRSFLAVSILLFLAVNESFATSAEQLVQDAFHQHLYVTATELINGPVDLGLPSRKIKKWKEKIADEIKRMDSGSYLDRLYAGGYEAWRRSDKEEIIRLWGHFLAAAQQLDPDGSKAIIEEVAVRVTPLVPVKNSQKRILPSNIDTPLIPLTEAPPSMKLKKSARKKKESSSGSSKAFDRVVLRAEEEKSAGRLESALWLFRQAHRMKPESKLVKERLEDLNQEMELEKRPN